MKDTPAEPIDWDEGDLTKKPEMVRRGKVINTLV